MALTQCRECEQQVSDEANSCPHCGVPNPAGTGGFTTSTSRSPAKSLSSDSEESGGCLGGGLIAVGAVWGLIGAGNIIIGLGNISDTGGGEGMAGANLMINMLLFVFPGLLLAGLGAALRKR